jgi:large subunit ribosomal protein L28
MARVCDLSGKKVMYGHNVAHSNTKTNRRFEPNLQRATLYSDGLRRKVPLRVCTRALRTVQAKGGLDPYLLKTADVKLAPVGLKLKRQLKKALAKASPASS